MAERTEDSDLGLLRSKEAFRGLGVVGGFSFRV